MEKTVRYFKKCTHSNAAVICQYKKYQFIKDRAVRMCHCSGQCPVRGRRDVK